MDNLLPQNVGSSISYLQFSSAGHKSHDLAQPVGRESVIIGMPGQHTACAATQGIIIFRTLAHSLHRHPPAAQGHPTQSTQPILSTPYPPSTYFRYQPPSIHLALIHSLHVSKPFQSPLIHSNC